MEVSRLTQRLDLNARQQAAVKTILQNEHQQYAHLVRNPSLTAVDRFNRLRALRESTVSQIKGVLDKEQQNMYDQLRHTPPAESPTQSKGEAKDQRSGTILSSIRRITLSQGIVRGWVEGL